MSRKQAYLLFVVLSGVFMGGLDMSIVSPALLSLQREWNVAERWLTWALTVYSLVYVISMPLIAKLSARISRKWTFMGAVGIFGLGSLVCGIAPNYGIFLLGRAAQAVGGGGIFPLATAEIGDTFPPKQRGTALGMLGGVIGVAAVIGPNLGGWLIEHYGWQYVFFINLPISIIIILMANFLEAHKHAGKHRPFDLKGAVLLSLMLFVLMFGLSQINSSNLVKSFFVGMPVELAEGESKTLLDTLGEIPVILYLLASGTLLFAFLRVEESAADPMIQVDLLKKRQLATTNGVSFFAGIAMSSMFFIPALASTMLGLSDERAGNIVTPIALTMFFAAPGLGALLPKLGSRIVVATGTLIAAFGMFLLGSWSDSMNTFIIALIPIGVGLGALVGSPLNYIVVNNVPPKQRATGISILTIFRNVGIVIGPTLAGALLASNAAANMGPAMRAAMNMDKQVMQEMMQMDKMMPLIGEAIAAGDITQEESAQIGVAMMGGDFDREATEPEVRDALDTFNARYMMPQIAEATGAGTMPYFTMQALDAALISEQDVARIASVMMGGGFSMDQMDSLSEDTRAAMDRVLERYVTNPVMEKGFRQVYRFLAFVVLLSVALTLLLPNRTRERAQIATLDAVEH